MIRKKNFLSLITTLGLLFCSLGVQAMEKEEDRQISPTIIQKVKDTYVFDYWALGQITTIVMQDVVFPQEVIDIISNKIVVATDDLLNFLDKKRLEDFYRGHYVLDGKKNLTIKNEFYCYYNEHFYTISEETRRNLVIFYLQNVSEAQIPLNVQSIELIDFEITKCICTYKCSILPEKTNNIEFTITFVGKNYMQQRKNYAMACFNDLVRTHVGSHTADYYPSWTEYNKAYPCREGAEASWRALETQEYEAYDRRMEYNNASEARKKEMEEETSRFRDGL